MTDHSLNIRVSRVLAAGLVLALVLMAAGVVAALVEPGPVPHNVTPLSDLPAGLREGQSGAFLSAGLLVLLATPAVRVLIVFGSYVRKREWLFAAIAFSVLLVLLLSAALGMV